MTCTALYTHKAHVKEVHTVRLHFNYSTKKHKNPRSFVYYWLTSLRFSKSQVKGHIDKTDAKQKEPQMCVFFTSRVFVPLWLIRLYTVRTLLLF